MRTPRFGQPEDIRREISKQNTRFNIAFWSTIAFLCFLFLGILYGVDCAKGATIDARDQLKSYVGKQIVLDNDTLTVVNYNLGTKDLVLSNGVDVDMDIAERYQIKE